MSSPVQEGDILAGKYRVDKVLGVGGMGVVVAAHHIHLDDKVALKFLLPEVVENREVVTRFTREARAAVKIKSEHVARVSDVGALESGAPYMVMEYLDGIDLEGWLKEQGPLPVQQAVEFALQACEALAEAHALGIVHRDLKPANLFVIRRADGSLSVKILDFGISKATRPDGDGADLSLTKTSAMMGSPLYMSPEQLRSSKDVDSRTDIWAMGVVLYELLTGKVPFDADALPVLFHNVLTAEPAPLVELRAGLPSGLETVILRCLEKDREARFQNVAELTAALYPFGPPHARISVERASRLMGGAALSVSALDLPPSSDAPAQASNTAGPLGRTSSAMLPLRRMHWLTVSVAVGVVGLGGYAATRALGGGSAPERGAAGASGGGAAASSRTGAGSGGSEQEPPGLVPMGESATEVQGGNSKDPGAGAAEEEPAQQPPRPAPRAPALRPKPKPAALPEPRPAIKAAPKPAPPPAVPPPAVEPEPAPAPVVPAGQEPTVESTLFSDRK